MVTLQEKLRQHIDALPGETVKTVLSEWVGSSDFDLASLEQALAEKEATLQAYDAMMEGSDLLEAFPPRTEDEITAECDQRLQKFQQTRHAISPQDVDQWVKSLGSDNPLPCPQ